MPENTVIKLWNYREANIAKFRAYDVGQTGCCGSQVVYKRLKEEKKKKKKDTVSSGVRRYLSTKAHCDRCHCECSEGSEGLSGKDHKK